MPRLHDFCSRSKKRKRVLHLALNKALCECVRSTLLWCNLLVETLVGIGFALHICDLCVADADAKGSQCTIDWHVDNNKTSHNSEETVRDTMFQLESMFGPTSSNFFGPEHDFQGMKLIVNNKKVSIDVRECLNKAFDDFGDIGITGVVTPAKTI